MSGYTNAKCLKFYGSVPYIAIGGSVMKFDGTNWVYVGSPNIANAAGTSIHSRLHTILFLMVSSGKVR